MHRASLIATWPTGLLPMPRCRATLSPLDQEMKGIGFESVREDQHIAGHRETGLQLHGGWGQGGDFVLEEVEFRVRQTLEVRGGEDEALAAGFVLFFLEHIFCGWIWGTGDDGPMALAASDISRGLRRIGDEIYLCEESVGLRGGRRVLRAQSHNAVA